MNIAEIQAWRQQTEVKREAERRLALLTGDSEIRQEQETGIDVEKLYFDNPGRYTQLYIAHAKVAYLMVKNLMVAPQSEYLGPITEKHRPLFRIQRRSVGTDDIGTWEATATVPNGETIDTGAFEFSARHQDGSRQTILELAKLSKFTSSLRHIDLTDFGPMSSRRETVAAVCEQAGVEVIPVTFEAVSADQMHP